MAVTITARLFCLRHQGHTRGTVKCPLYSICDGFEDTTEMTVGLLAGLMSRVILIVDKHPARTGKRKWLKRPAYAVSRSTIHPGPGNPATLKICMPSFVAPKDGPSDGRKKERHKTTSNKNEPRQNSNVATAAGFSKSIH